jgi:hypothetical protein
MLEEVKRATPPRAQPATTSPTIIAAVDLYALIRSLPADGRMSAEDMQVLSEWAARYHDATLPSRENLWDIVAGALARGTISPEDRSWLYFAVDPALPRQLRRVVQRQRLLNEVRDARVTGQACNSVSFDFLLAGGHLSGYRERIQTRLAVRTPVRFARDGAPVDSNDRIRVELASGECIGFVPVDDAPSIAHGPTEKRFAEGVVKKILFDGLFPIPVIGTQIPYSGAVAPEVPVPIERWREVKSEPRAADAPAKSPLSALTRALGAKLKPVTDLFR